MRDLSAAPSIDTDIAVKSYADDLSQTFAPEDLGYKAWAYDPAVANAGQLLTAGVLTLTRVNLRRAATVSNLIIYVQTAGATLANCGIALYNAAGTSLLASLVNSGNATTTAWQSTGVKVCAITPQSLAAGAYYVGFWSTGTTQPQLLRTSAGGSTMNPGFTLASGTGLRFAAANTGLTTAAPSTFTQTGNAAAAYWAAVS